MVGMTETRVIAGGGDPENHLEVIVDGGMLRLSFSGDGVEDTLCSRYFKISDLLAGKCDADGLLESITNTDDGLGLSGIEFNFCNEDVCGFYAYSANFEEADEFLVCVRINRLLLEQCA